MKSPWKLQEKLQHILAKQSKLRLLIPAHPWDDIEMKQAASVVQDYVDSRSDVIESEPLKDWLEEYRFYRADFKA